MPEEQTMPESDSAGTQFDEITRILKTDEMPINKAVSLSNLMTHCDNTEAGQALALAAGKEALRIINDHGLYYAPGADGNKAAAMKGYIDGAIRRLEGKGLDYHYFIPFAAAYASGALLGAWAGLFIQFGYNTTNAYQIRFPDARAFLAPVAAILFVFVLRGIFARLGVVVSAIVGLFSAIQLAGLYYQLGFPASVVAGLGLFILPWFLWSRLSGGRRV
jgi:hypothetical protein